MARNVLCIFFLFFLNEESRTKCKKEKEKLYIKECRIEITLKEHPGRTNLPVPHYSLDGRSFQEMDLSVGH